MRVFEVVLARVANVENMRDSESFDHLSILGVLPLAQVNSLGEHLVAETFLGYRPDQNSQLTRQSINQLGPKLRRLNFDP